MPFCEVPTDECSSDPALNNAIQIFYRTYGRGPTKVLLIIGLAGTHDSWGPQIKGLTGTDKPNEGETIAGEGKPDRAADNEGGGGVEVCAFDNRGMGRSSVPTSKSLYTTEIMATDAMALLDHLGWKKAHVFGHSMGAMIACKLAAMVPDSVLSLALLNVTGGGFECFPKFDRQNLSIAIRFLRAKTPEQRAAVDLDTHYTKEYLDEYVGSNTRRSILYQEYVKGITATGMQSNFGFDGQVNACWTHKMTGTEIELIRTSGFLVSIIHGRQDVIAQVSHAKRLAEKLQPVARMVELHGGHMVSHERTEEVNLALLDLIKASEKKINPQDWNNIPKKSSDNAINSLVRVVTNKTGYTLSNLTGQCLENYVRSRNDCIYRETLCLSATPIQFTCNCIKLWKKSSAECETSKGWIRTDIDIIRHSRGTLFFYWVMARQWLIKPPANSISIHKPSEELNDKNLSIKEIKGANIRVMNITMHQGAGKSVAE